MNQSTALTVFDTNVHLDQDGRFSLNDIHKAAMAKGYATPSQIPSAFLSSDKVKDFIRVLELETGKPVIKTRKGRGITGTYAVRLIALRYAGWLRAEVEIEVYDTFDQVKRADEGLTANLIDRQRDPEASKRLAIRAQGKATRNALTSTLASHGVTGRGYADCTNAIYTPILGGPASEIRESRQLKPAANLREHMSGKELAAVMLSEEIARERIDQTNARGNEPCSIECNSAARRVRSIL
jgi:hypothetical protein